jgi:hypothetical protein
MCGTFMMVATSGFSNLGSAAGSLVERWFEGGLRFGLKVLHPPC